MAKQTLGERYRIAIERGEIDMMNAIESLIDEWRKTEQWLNECEKEKAKNKEVKRCQAPN